MNTCYVVRSSRPEGLFSFDLLDGLPVRFHQPYLRATPAGFGLERLATAFMNNPGLSSHHVRTGMLKPAVRCLRRQPREGRAAAQCYRILEVLVGQPNHVLAHNLVRLRRDIRHPHFRQVGSRGVASSPTRTPPHPQRPRRCEIPSRLSSQGRAWTMRSEKQHVPVFSAPDRLGFGSAYQRLKKLYI
jgi:hypothetical protein